MQSTKATSHASIYHAKESYWGHVQSNTYLSSFAEAVRAAETMALAYKTRNGVDVSGSLCGCSVWGEVDWSME